MTHSWNLIEETDLTYAKLINNKVANYETFVSHSSGSYVRSEETFEKREMGQRFHEEKDTVVETYATC